MNPRPALILILGALVNARVLGLNKAKELLAKIDKVYQGKDVPKEINEVVVDLALSKVAPKKEKEKK